MEKDAPCDFLMRIKQAMITTRIPKTTTAPTTQSAIKPGVAAKWSARETESHINIWLKGNLGSRKIFPKRKVHTIKYLKIAMICSVIRFVEINRVNKIVILLPQAAIFFS